MRPDLPVPENYAEWRYCLTVDCRIALTRGYIEQRLAELRDPRVLHTRQFIHSWGQEHLQRVIHWFEQALAELD